MAVSNPAKLSSVISVFEGGNCLSGNIEAQGDGLTCLSQFAGLDSGASATLTGEVDDCGMLQLQEVNLSTLALAQGWDGVSPINFRVPANTWIWSDNTSIAAITVPHNIPPGSTLTNSGFIIGRGGNGNGGFGGAAIEIQAPGFAVVNNAGAYIAGGGGAGHGVTTNLGRAQSAGGGGGAGGGTGSRGSGNANSNFIAGGSVGKPGGGGAEAGASGGTGNDGGGSGGGRILPGVAHGVNGGAGGQDGGDFSGLTAGGGGGWGACGGDGGFGVGGQAGSAIISTVTWNGLENNGTVFGPVAPASVGAQLNINKFENHQEISLSELGVTPGSTLTIPQDFFIWSDNTSVAALTIDVNNVTIINNGNIMGRGGNGGGSSGGDGGPAINVTATGVTINNTSTGFIGGGGGGGGRGIVNINRGQFGGGGGGAGGGRGAFGGSNPRGSGTIIAGGLIGGKGGGGAGAEVGGSGSTSGPGGGGGRVVPGNGDDGFNGVDFGLGGGGGGYGAPGGRGRGNTNAGAGGAAIAGNAVALTNNGVIWGSTFAGLSGFVNGGDRGATADITPSSPVTVPAGAVATFTNSSSGTSNPLKTATLWFDGVAVASYSSGVGGTPGSFCRTDGTSVSGPITLTGGPYTPTLIELSVSGAASTLPGLGCPANISSSVSVVAG